MSAKEDCKKLLAAVLPFAEHMLSEHGEFYPFGAQMLMDGEIGQVGASTGEEMPKSTELISILQAGYKQGALDGTLLATALVYDVHVNVAESDRVWDAIAVLLDHRDRYSVKAYFPYSLDSSDGDAPEPFSKPGDYAIFPPFMP